VRALGLTPLALGLIFAVGSVGGLLGALLIGRVARRRRPHHARGAVALSAAAPLPIPLAMGPAAALLLAGALFVRGIGEARCNVHVVSMRQAITPDHLLGRMNGSYCLITWGAIPFGALPGGSLGLTTTVLWFVLSPVRRLWRVSLRPHVDHHAATHLPLEDLPR